MCRESGQRELREPATDVRLDGDEMTADPDDGDAVDPSVHARATLAASTDTSERVLEDLDVCAARTEPDARHVEPNASVLEPAPIQVRVGEVSDPPPLGPRHGLVPAPERGAGTRLDLAEHEQVSPDDHQIELAEVAPPVPRDQREAPLLVDAERRVLPRAPAFGSPVRRGSAHPPTLDRAADTPPSPMKQEGPAEAGPSPPHLAPAYGVSWLILVNQLVRETRVPPQLPKPARLGGLG